MPEDEAIAEVDEQGRLVLPSRLRERIGLKKGGRVSVRLEGPSKIVIMTKPMQDVEKRIEKWFNTALNTKAQVFTEQRDNNDIQWKWMTSEYARRKLGLAPQTYLNSELR